MPSCCASVALRASASERVLQMMKVLLRSAAVGVLWFARTAHGRSMKALVLMLDLAGTFVFALAGATAAARRQLDIFGVLVVAFAAACSGGIMRDVLIGATPPAAISDWRYLATSLIAGVIAFRWHATIER